MPAQAAAPRPTRRRPVTFSSDIAPIVYRRCAECHRAGDIAPMSLMTYDEVRPWAKSIKKAVASGEMPPWDASPAVGHFKNDISLPKDEIDKIVAWVDAGAPEGDPAALPPKPTFPSGWRLGEPDAIVDLPSFDVADSGRRSVPVDLRRARQHRDQVRARGRAPHRRPPVLHHMVLFQGPFAMTQDIVDHARARQPQEPDGRHAQAALRVGGGVAADRVPRGHGPRAQRQPGADAQHALPPERQSRHRHLEARPLLRRQGAGEGVPDRGRDQAVAANPGELATTPTTPRTSSSIRTARCSRTCRTCTSAASAVKYTFRYPDGRERGRPRRAAVQLRLAVDLSARRAQGRSRRHAAPGRRAVGQLRRQPAQPEPQRRSRVRRRHRRRDAGRLRRLRGEGRRAPGAGADRERAAPPDGPPPRLDRTAISAPPA